MACNVGLCVIGKMENDYAREFVEYYHKLGISKIILYDNNDLDGEHFEDSIGDYIENGFVEVIDYRGRKKCQIDAYNNCIINYLKDFDWICFFDFDEYLHIDGFDSIVDWLSQDKFNYCQLIHVNWMVYDDNNLVENPTKKVVETFKNPKMPFDFKKALNVPENAHVKSIINKNGANLRFTWNPHSPTQFSFCKDCNGNFINGFSPFLLPIRHNSAHIKHYMMKTISEYINNKIVRGYPDMDRELADKFLTIEDFFLLNDKTDEKIEWLRKNVGISI